MKPNKKVIIISLIVLTLGVYIVLAYNFFFNWHQIEQFFIIIPTFILLLVVILLLQKFWDTNQRFTKQEFLLNSVRHVLSGIHVIHSIHELRVKILEKITNILNVSGMALEMRTEQSSIRIATGILEQTDGSYDIAERYDVYSKASNSAVLYVAPKRNGFDFTKEERSAIKFISNYFAVALENLELLKIVSERLTDLLYDENSQDFDWTRRFFFQLLEHDRQRISTSLHDTILQDIYFFMQCIHKELRDNEALQQDNHLKKMHHDYLERLDMLNLNLRETCYELYPYILEELGLEASLKYYFNQEQSKLDSHLEIHCDVRDLNGLNQLQLEQKLLIYRIIQELWTNTKKHAQASLVHIRLSVDSGMLHFIYQDNGVGFITATTTATEHSQPIDILHGTGLRQMRSRLKMLSATWQVQSSPNTGFRLEANIPIPQAHTYQSKAKK